MEAFDAAGVTGIVWRRVEPEKEEAAEALMRQLMMLARQSEGYQGSEIFPPIPGVQDGYVVLYRFSRGTHLREWLASTAKDELRLRVAELLEEPAREFFFTHGRNPAGSASSVFAYRIQPEREAAFQEWRHRIMEDVRKQKGFLGTESFDALDCTVPEFIVVVRFDNRTDLDAWLNSPIHQAYMVEVRRIVDHVSLRRIGSGFEGWFDVSANSAPPAKWRQALVILSALFPVIMVFRHLLAGLFNIVPLPVAFLILLTLDLAFLTYIVMPRYTRLMNFWLHSPPDATWRHELAGWAIIMGILGVTLGAFLSLV
jgi:uncharacterized protein